MNVCGINKRMKDKARTSLKILHSFAHFTDRNTESLLWHPAAPLSSVLMSSEPWRLAGKFPAACPRGLSISGTQTFSPIAGRIFTQAHSHYTRTPKFICRNQIAGAENQMLNQDSIYPPKVDSLRIFFERKDKVHLHSKFHRHMFRMEKNHPVVARVKQQWCLH